MPCSRHARMTRVAISPRLATRTLRIAGMRAPRSSLRKQPGDYKGFTMTPSLLDHHDVRSSFDLLAAWIEAQVAYRGWPGLSIAVVHDQDVVWSQGFGWADVERRTPATAHTLYRVASITKTFTATAIMQLRDAGKLRLDDAVRDHLAWF